MRKKKSAGVTVDQALQMREKLFKDLQGCNTYDDLQDVLKYKADLKKNGDYKLPKNMPLQAAGNLVGLNYKIEELIKKKKALYPAGNPSETVASASNTKPATEAKSVPENPVVVTDNLVSKIQPPNLAITPVSLTPNIYFEAVTNHPLKTLNVPSNPQSPAENKRNMKRQLPTYLEPTFLKSKHQSEEKQSALEKELEKKQTALKEEAEAVKEKRRQAITKVTEQLKVIYEKYKEHLAEVTLENYDPEVKAKYVRAANAALAIYFEIKKLADDYVNFGDLGRFQTHSKPLLEHDNANMRELSTHRRWKEVLLNLALFIAGVGVGYAAVCAYRGSFFKFATDSSAKVDKLHDEISAVVAPAC